MKVTDKITITNEDNIALMARYPDNYFDLAIVDPPYGNNLSGGRSNKNGWNNKINWDKCNNDWNIKTPSIKYFKELKRVSKNQIIWGGNYFANMLPNSECWIMWDKGQRDFSLADGEIAWTSFNKAIRIFEFSRASCIKSNNMAIEKFHPTAKPFELYKWLLDKYAKPNDKILDTHLGSGSIAIACHDYNFELTACELDKEYYDKAIERIKNHVSQLKMF
jgi:site-specific DNA-methyltransferase (adenine-specific)